MLGQLETELAGRVQNFHFTDVILDGEMTFDYVLHPGVVRTSNALRLLALAGIDVPQALQDDNAIDAPMELQRGGEVRT
jgi:DNA mismatch repair ATPase MutS